MRNLSPGNRYGLGWRRQLPDHRDLVYAASAHVMAKLPPHVDLRSSMPPIWDQGELGSCTAHGVGALMQFMHMKERHADAARRPSRLMLYWLAREMEGAVNEDTGAEIRDVVKAAVRWGTAFEGGGSATDEWPYDIAKYRERPPQRAFTAASKFEALEYRAPLQVSQQLRAVLAGSLPFTFGVTLYSSFESEEVARTGIVPMPHPQEAPMGGHCMVAVGYDDTGTIGPARHFLVRNSWSKKWGVGGHCWMPYEYLLRQDLAADFWVISRVE